MLRNILALSCAFFILASVQSAADELKLGSTLPDITATAQDGAEVQLADYADKPYLLVFFYPKAHTGGCTKQACSLRDAYDELTELGVTVLGVSADGTDNQASFKEKFGFQYTLLADPEHHVANSFGVPLIANGKLTARQAYLFKEGKLVWIDKTASTAKQADDVKKAIAVLDAA